MIQIIKTLLFSGMTIFIMISLIQFPDQALEASIRGLNLWWEVVFPSLLPFFITAELLLAFGVVNFIGVLFEPIMRPLFNIPGVGSFGWMMGMASGYPTGAKIAARLREEGQLTQIEAERLVAFTNNSSPLFIFGAISVGFFHDASLGVLIAVCHYTSNAIVGIVMRFHGRSKKKILREKRERVSLTTAFKAMHRTRLKDKRPFGEILGDAVLNSIKTLIMVGGFITLFSVLIKLLFLVGVTPAIAGLFKVALSLFSLPIEFALPFLSGLFEITIGANMITQITTESLLPQLILISFILGFNGFSIQAQVASILAKTDIRFLPYFFARLLHGTLASILTIILYKPLYLNKETSQTSVPASQASDNNIGNYILDLVTQNGALLTFFSLGIAIIILYRRNMKKQ
ncbi:sporulation integral membrane protein YlbJ [Oceanobacillus chungangensis]|nr:sporulation integral membrane protein YlbJ [Oceanobacillus chungangensis]